MGNVKATRQEDARCAREDSITSSTKRRRVVPIDRLCSQATQDFSLFAARKFSTLTSSHRDGTSFLPLCRPLYSARLSLRIRLSNENFSPEYTSFIFLQLDDTRSSMFQAHEEHNSIFVTNKILITLQCSRRR